MISFNDWVVSESDKQKKSRCECTCKECKDDKNCSKCSCEDCKCKHCNCGNK